MTIVQAIRIRTIAALATYTESKPIIEWSIVEINMGVIVACVPAFSPLLKNFSKKISYNSRSRSGAYGQKTGNKSKVTTQGQKSNAATGSRTPLSRSRILASFRDDDEMELCETKNGWAGDSHGWNTANIGPTATQVHTVGIANDGDSDRGSGTSSQLGQHQQQITVVHEYTVQIGEAK